jgi:hypothetical protein
MAEKAIAPQRIAIRVRETAGMKRFGYPATARVPFPQGALKDEKNVRLLDAQGKAVPAQVTTTEKYPDGFIKWLEVDVNLSPAPLEAMEFQLEYGAGVTGVPPTRGLTFTETAETFQVSAYYTIRKDGNPLVQRVNYGREYLKEGGINVFVREGNVERHLRDAKNLKWSVVKQGAFQVRLRCEGEYPASDGKPALPFTLTLEFSSSKSWVGVTHTVRSSAKNKVILTLVSHFNLAGQLLWDTDVGYWLYGIINPDERMTFSQTSEEWICYLGKTGQERYAARAPASQAAKGWGHFQEAKDNGNVVAFGVAHFGVDGKHDVIMESSGTMVVRHEPTPQTAPQLRVFFHFIPVPLQRTAQTSPPAMMLPLVATCPAEHYRKCGVPIPPEAR